MRLKIYSVAALVLLFILGRWVWAAPLTAPMVAGCPAQPLVWPVPSSCKYNFYPLTDSTHAVASVSKTAPQYLHTLGGYTNKATLIVACPINATVTTDLARCIDQTGADASALITISALSTFSITAPGPDYTSVISYTVEQSYDAGATWDPISTTVTYPSQPVGHCFRITANRANGKGPPLTSCPLPQ